jgi:hypothetical protein
VQWLSCRDINESCNVVVNTDTDITAHRSSRHASWWVRRRSLQRRTGRLLREGTTPPSAATIMVSALFGCAMIELDAMAVVPPAPAG